jgi:transposase-like protein
MSRKPRVDRSPEEKWQIVLEGIKSGNVSETCRRHSIAPNLFYRWKDEAELTLPLFETIRQQA